MHGGGLHFAKVEVSVLLENLGGVDWPVASSQQSQVELRSPKIACLVSLDVAQLIFSNHSLFKHGLYD